MRTFDGRYITPHAIYDLHNLEYIANFHIHFPIISLFVSWCISVIPRIKVVSLSFKFSNSLRLSGSIALLELEYLQICRKVYSSFAKENIIISNVHISDTELFE